jgi:hypothetical protein
VTAIIGGVVIFVTCAITGANGVLHLIAGVMIGFGLDMTAKVLKLLR